MKAKEFYDEALELVLSVTRQKEEDIFCQNKESCVDARYILVGVLSNYFTDDEIVSFTGLSRSTANKIRNCYQPKMKKFSFRCKYHEVADY
jgi:hypothetical protein